MRCGVGKTALAVHAAHRLRGRFPDRQLFIDLHAHTPGQRPAAPAAALAELLTAAGVDGRYLPADLDGRAMLWRDRLAGQRALLVLDNAASSDQVAPLLPGGDGCLVLVTSRRYLGDLPGAVVPVLLEALPPDQAQLMFARLAPRAATEPTAVLELVRLAGYLPLAIWLLARVYAKHPSWTLADLADETSASLLTLAAEKDSVAAAFEVSYRDLAPGQQQFFRRLGLHPGTTIDGYAAAALAGIPLQEAARQLDDLHGEGLLTEVGYRRYGMHDLIRRYVQDRAATDPATGRGQALQHLLDYYQHTAAAAEAWLARQPRTRPAPAALISPPAAVPDLPDRVRALSWARAERANLLACLDYVTRTGQHARVVALTTALAALLSQDGPRTDAITRNTTAIQAARHLGDRLGEANALTYLGAVRWSTGDHPQAARVLEAALVIYCDLGDRLGEANALSYLGLVRLLTGDFPGVAGVLEAALVIYCDLGDRLGEANALSYLGLVRLLTGDFPGVAGVLEAALVIYCDLGDRLGEANALSYLGLVRLLTGDFPGAAGVLQAALGIARDLGYRQVEADALSSLGLMRWSTGDYLGAAGALEAALGIYRDLGYPQGEANALSFLGAVRWSTGDYPGAAEALEAALGIARDLGYRLGEANALTYLGAVRWSTGDYPGAAEALGIARDLGYRLGEANALTYLGAVRRQTGDYPGAAGALEAALGICRDLGYRQGKADALNQLGAVRRQTGNYPGATEALEAALGIARDLGHRRGEGDALNQLGAVRRQTGDYPGADGALEAALGICRDLGYRGGEAEALNEVGTLHRARGDADRAAACHRQALDLAREIGSPWDEAHALAGLGRCALAAGHTADPEAGLRQAQEIFQRIGAAEAVGVAAELAALTGAGPA